MLAAIEIDFYCNSALAKLSREGYARLSRSVPQLGLGEWKEDAEKPPHFFAPDDIIIDLTTDGPHLVEAGISFKIKRYKGTFRAGVFENPNAPGTSYHLHVAIPAVGLLMMDEVTNLDDPCTDELQGMLRAGWRIIAVCPPDTQRRPDYILGRSPEMRATHGGGR